MIDNNNWYFDNITEAIIYGDVRSGGAWLAIARQIKKNAVIIKMANDKHITTATLPAVLGKAIDNYRENQ